jgi:hypothetical protein
VLEGFFVERDSNAIAFLPTQVGRRVTRWGLFLTRGVQPFFFFFFFLESVAYGKRGWLIRARTQHSTSFFADRLFWA